MADTELSRGKRIFQLVLLVLAAGSIYPLVYLRQNFEATILTVYDLSQAELAGLYSMLGIMFVVGYIPSGWLADRINVKWLIIFSLLLTAATGVVYAQIPDKRFLVYIFLVWGFATVFTFWSAILKTVSLLAEANEGGRYFGVLDGGRGLVEAILASVAVGLFAFFSGGEGAGLTETTAGFQAVVYMYVAFILLVAILLTFVLSSKVEERAETKEKVVAESTYAAIRRIVKIPDVWLMIVVLFCGYVLFWGHYYFSGFLNVNHSVSPVTAGVVTVVVLWMRPVGGVGGGFLADRFGRSKILSISMFITAGTLVLLTLIPSGSMMWLVYATVVFAGLLMYVIRGVYWSLLEDVRIPVAAVGVGIGVISFFGYLPDIIIPRISQAIYNGFGDDVAGANNVFFVVTAVFGLVGAVTAAYFAMRMTKREKAEKGLKGTAAQS